MVGMTGRCEAVTDARVTLNILGYCCVIIIIKNQVLLTSQDINLCFQLSLLVPHSSHPDVMTTCLGVVCSLPHTSL